MSRMQKTYEQWLMQANEGLHRMRSAGAGTMPVFADRDPVGFCMMVDAMKGLEATITPEVEEIWRNLKYGTLKAGNVSKATRPVQSARESVA